MTDLGDSSSRKVISMSSNSGCRLPSMNYRAVPDDLSAEPLRRAPLSGNRRAPGHFCQDGRKPDGKAENTESKADRFLPFILFSILNILNLRP